MSNTTQNRLSADDILALLREFNIEAENLITHLEAIGHACQAKLDIVHVE